MNKFSILKVFTLRFYSLFPLIWIIIFAYSCFILLQSKLIFRKIVPLLILLFSFLAFSGTNRKDYYGSDFAENSFYNTFINNLSQGYASFDTYYKTELFNELKKQLPLGSYYVACIGFEPEIAQYNGYYTIDGYFFYYSKKYNQIIADICAKEMKKSSIKSIGNRCQMIVNDILIGKTVIDSLQLDFDRLKQLGTTHIFSAKKIIHEKLIGIYIVTKNTDSLFIYSIK